MDYEYEVSADRHRAIQRASQIFQNDIGAIVAFLSTPHSDLEGATPDVILGIPGGIDNVMQLLDKIESERTEPGN